MKILRYLIVSVVVTLFMPSMPFGIVQSSAGAQTLCGSGVSGCSVTTLSSALSAGSKNQYMVVASNSGINATTTSVNVLTQTGGQSFCMVDKEIVQVAAINSTTLTVRRGIKGQAAGHISGAHVICGYGATFNPTTGYTTGIFLGLNGNTSPTGSCTRANQQFLPLFGLDSTYNNGFTYDCLGGKWVQGTGIDDPNPTPITLACTVGMENIGNVAYSSLGTSTTDAVAEFESSIWVPKTAYITGLSLLVGGGTMTDSVIGILRDKVGNLITYTAVAGTALSASNNTFQNFPLAGTAGAASAAQFVVGPAWYNIGFQGNGTTAGQFRTIASSTYINVVGNSLTAGTFGTIPATQTIPTTLTGNKAPISCIYY